MAHMRVTDWQRRVIGRQYGAMQGQARKTRGLLVAGLLAGVACGVLAQGPAWARSASTAPAVQDVARSDGLHALPVTNVQVDALPGVAEAEPSLFIPCDGAVGLAAFWSGAELMVVVDRTLPALLHLPAEGGVFDRRERVALNGATLLRLYLPDHPHVVFARQKAGWLLCVAGAHTQGRCAPAVQEPAVHVRPQPARVLFAQSQPGQVITLPDPATGGRLFVGTTRQVEGSPDPHSAVGYAVRPAVLGVVVAADSAQLALRPTPDGPVLEAIAAQPLPVGLPARPPSASVQQGQDWLWLGFKAASAPQLVQAWHTQRDVLGQAGQDPARLWTRRVAAAQAAFAAGAPQQAWALLRDLPVPPEHGVQNGALALRACAALLSGDLAGAAPLGTADWAMEPDMVLWRGAYLMASGADSTPTSVLLARGYARLEQYPAPVQAVLMPRVSWYLAQFGGVDERAVMGTLPDDPAYNLPRILLQARAGHAETARVALENLTASGDEQMADRARAQLVDFLRTHDQIGPDMAADAYGQLLAAQGAGGAQAPKGSAKAAPPEGAQANGAEGGAEGTQPGGAVGAQGGLLASLRLAYAQALAQAGQPVRAVGVLAALVPSEATPRDRLEAAWRTVLSALVFGPAQGTADAPAHGAKARGPHAAGAGARVSGPSGSQSAPAMVRTQFLALARANMEHVPDDPLKAKLLAGLGRQLVAQGQAAQAVPVLQQADVLAIEPLMRADIEEQLAQAALQSNQRPLALRALERSALPNLPEDLAARRRYDEAQLAAASGNREGAQALLAEDESDTGLSVRGALYEQDQQWAQAVLVVGRLASRTLPEQGDLTTTQRNLVIRLASDAAAAGDAATLRNLQAWVGKRPLGAERQALFAALLRQVQKAPVVSLGVVAIPGGFDKSVKEPK
ncbi:hypothetical protein [Acetobacter syzygii]|nr:hypothetical protein [Acetobacter syzygii]